MSKPVVVTVEKESRERTDIDTYLDELSGEAETVERACNFVRSGDFSLQEEAGEKKVLVSKLPHGLATYLKKMTNKRAVTVQGATQVRVTASMHAPEYDNFDYSYYTQVNLHSGYAVDLRAGMKPLEKEARTVALTPGNAVVWGQLKKWAVVYLHPEDYAALL